MRVNEMDALYCTNRCVLAKFNFYCLVETARRLLIAKNISGLMFVFPVFKAYLY